MTCILDIRSYYSRIMMFSQTSEYALRVVLSLASSGDRPLTIPQLSEITSTPPDYLAKVIRGLAKTGLIISQRGAHGGSVLARATEKITVYDVMQAVDPIQRIITCPLKLPNHGTNLCPLHRRLDDAIGMVEDAFRKTSIADLIAEKSESRPLGDALVDVTTRAFPAAGTASSKAARAASARRKR